MRKALNEIHSQLIALSIERRQIRKLRFGRLVRGTLDLLPLPLPRRKKRHKVINLLRLQHIPKRRHIHPAVHDPDDHVILRQFIPDVS